jgi:hypothetical protein
MKARARFKEIKLKKYKLSVFSFAFFWMSSGIELPKLEQ